MTKAQKEKEIEKYMKSLQISREEAEQLFEDDNSDEVLPEVAEMEKKVKSMPRRYEGGEKKKVVRERKIDIDKKELIELIVQTIQEKVEVKSVKTETEIEFSYKGESYTLKLTKHRKKSDN